MCEVKIRPPVRRRIFRCAFSGETGIGRMKGGRVSAVDGHVSVRGAEAGDEARDAAERGVARAG